MEYKNTVNLLDTAFAMRGDLAKREPAMLDKWNKENRYQKVREICAGRDKFILHDGPPYANGKLHVGHAQNKILKDIIIRSKTIAGFDAPYIPGWDCHGLPIELNIEKKFGKNLPASEFRDKCRAYAAEQIDQQRTDFMRLGIIGDWQNPYKTMEFATEANTIRALAEIHKSGYLFKGVKPVHWCIDCGSSLAEAEVEYSDKVSPAIDVAFKAVNSQEVAAKFGVELKENAEVFAVIWTTTPWTLPANQAICAGPEVEYALVDAGCSYVLVAKDLVDAAIKRYSFIENYSIAATTLGQNLENLQFQHPFYKRVVPMILGEHATADAGTGLVHTAPAHGMDDYLVGLKYDLPMDNPVAGNGCYISTTPLLAGMHVFKANDKVIEILQENQRLMAKSDLTHSYPCCWRHKSKIIYRTTSQWFIGMEKAGADGKTLRSKANKAVDDTGFFPAWGRARLESMVKNRPDWCISRQRNWGVPLAFFAHKETGELHPNSYELAAQVAKLVEERGINAWFELDIKDILSGEDCQNYAKLPDTIDVWFDSGTTHFSVLKQRSVLQFPADLYLEGSDQHRGWFQSSLLTSCAINGIAPYKQLLTHSFVVDGQGYKMSKSKGNIVSLIDAVNKSGADILRLWVASTDYSDDVGFSDEILKRVTESYRRIRNTIRFLLSNIDDFDIKKDAVAIYDMVEIDQYALANLAKFQKRIVDELYPAYQFHTIVQELVMYCSEELGGFYLDVLKDRLYTAAPNSHARRSAQTALYHITKTLLLMVSPILAFTADEAWEVLEHNVNDSTLYHTNHQIPEVKDSNELYNKWMEIKKFRTTVLSELEAKRIEGLIGASLQANLVIKATGDLYTALASIGADLKFAYMVSNIKLEQSTVNSVEVLVSSDEKCERCWHYSDTIGKDAKHPTICGRCVENLEHDGETRRFA